MKGSIFQCMYDIDDSVYKYVAFNQDGSFCAFINPPVRNFSMGIWVDSVTGESGDFIPYEKWDQSMRETALLKNCHDPKINRIKRGEK